MDSELNKEIICKRHGELSITNVIKYKRIVKKSNGVIERIYYRCRLCKKEYDKKSKSKKSINKNINIILNNNLKPSNINRDKICKKHGVLHDCHIRLVNKYRIKNEEKINYTCRTCILCTRERSNRYYKSNKDIAINRVKEWQGKNKRKKRNQERIKEKKDIVENNIIEINKYYEDEEENILFYYGLL